MQILLKNVIGKRQCQCQIGSRANPQPLIGLCRSDRHPRVNHHHFCLVLQPPVIDHAKMHRAGFRLIIAEIHIKSGTAEIIFGIAVATATSPQRRLKRHPLGFRTKRLGITKIRRAPHLREQTDIAAPCQRAGAGAGKNSQRFRAILVAHCLQFGSNFGKRLIPADWLKFSLTTFTNTFQRCCQPFRTVVKL